MTVTVMLNQIRRRIDRIRTESDLLEEIDNLTLTGWSRSDHYTEEESAHAA